MYSYEDQQHVEKTKKAAEELKPFIEKAFKYASYGEVLVEVKADEPYTVSVEIPKEDIIIDIDYREIEVDGIVKTKEDSICYDIQTIKHWPATYEDPGDEELIDYKTTYRLISTVGEVLNLATSNRMSGVMESLELEYYEMIDEEVNSPE